MAPPNYASIFRRYIASQDEIRLFNVYQGIPISYPARVRAVGHDLIEIQTEKYQFICLYREKETYIQTSWLPAVVYARVASLDMSQLQAVLTGFKTTSGRIGNRTQVRVFPKVPIQGNIQSKDSTLTLPGELADLSIDGLGIDLHKKNYDPHIVQVGASVVTNFYLPGEYENRTHSASYSSAPENPISRFDRSRLRLNPLTGASRSVTISEEDSKAGQKVSSPQITVQATIVNICEEAFHRYIRLGLRILPGDPSRSIISQFISRRQSEIMREMKAMSGLF
jgi:hypothetical protein